MRILVSGSAGLVGTAFCGLARARGHEVLALVRKSAVSDSIPWDPIRGSISSDRLEGLDAVVHLAGENIAGGRWNAARKAAIMDSRSRGTRLLTESLGRLKQRPEVLISASAIGYYGNRGDEVLHEESGSGNGFLPEVCRAWEAAAEPAARAGIRVVHPRIGIVLASHGGALHKMLLPFRLGAGGRIGSGRQYMSWIVLEELAAVILHCIEDQTVRGPVNAVSPNPLTNADFTRVLGRVLSRPTLFPLPAFAARLLLGEMADALLLSSTRVVPSRLAASGYCFQHSDLENALRTVLHRSFVGGRSVH